MMELTSATNPLANRADAPPHFGGAAGAGNKSDEELPGSSDVAIQIDPSPVCDRWAQVKAHVEQTVRFEQLKLSSIRDRVIGSPPSGNILGNLCATLARATSNCVEQRHRLLIYLRCSQGRRGACSSIGGREAGKS